MNKNQEFEELHRLIKEQDKDLKVPKNLLPEQVEDTLNQKKSRKWKRGYTYSLVAACCFVVIGIGALTVRENAFVEKSQTSRTNMQVASAKTYKEIYKYLETNLESEQTEMSVKESSASDTSNALVASYSNTNVRQGGIDEGDYVKTDGNYIYVLKDTATEIAMIEARDNQMKVVGKISAPSGMQISEFYFKNQKLIALGTESVAANERGYCAEKTKTITYDISDKSNPRELGTVTQSGRYESSRLSGDYLYIFSQFSSNLTGKPEDIEQYIPSVQGEYIEREKIYLPIIDQGNSQTVISSIHLEQPDQVIDRTSILSYYDNCYVSDTAIYMYSSIYEEQGKSMKTGIRKITYEKGKLNAVAQCKINGTINDSFSIDEYKGNLRVVTTIKDLSNVQQPRWYDGVMPLLEKDDTKKDIGNIKEPKDSNSLYVLDETLEQLGSIQGLAEDEQVYSARFMGDIGYFVTFRQTDPLFSVDLKDPTKPKILGELKIPGFSEYLHPYGEGNLLGIGVDMDEKGITSDGIKLSMFHIEDPTNVQELQKHVIEGVYSSPVFYDYKAVLIDNEKNVIGFSAYGDSEKYYLFSYDVEKGFTCQLEAEIQGDSYQETRGVYINEVLYIIKGGIVESYSLQNYQKIDDLVLS